MNDISSTTPPNALRQRRPSPTGRPDRCDRVALVLQGGGALGAYQARVYQAMHEANILPDWVAGVSIGAINAAIIAGNPPHRRLAQLRAFWDMITERKIWAYTPDGDVFRKARNATSSWMTLVGGQPGFFTPRPNSPWFSFTGAQGATSYYDSSPLKETLNDLVDFSIINDQAIRFAVGAVNVLTGNFIYFDNQDEEIGPEHVMASGALPPALPMIKIGTDHFWDGGIVSNTPLQHLLDQDDSLNKLVFQVDLFSARGALPRDIQDAMARHKDIMYSSRTRYNTDVYRRTHKFAVEKSHKSTVVEGISEGPLRPSTYETLYFDTDNSDLRRHQVELSVRNRDGQVIQRVKTPAATGSILGCQSHEIVLGDLQPNLDHARALLAPNLRDAISRSALKPRFRTRFSRISHQFATDSSITRASFDHGCIEATGRSELISEVEFKLKGGRLNSYTQECLSFLAEVPAALLVESKAARGYRLACG